VLWDLSVNVDINISLEIHLDLEQKKIEYDTFPKL
jgi:hypothetical protein